MKDNLIIFATYWNECDWIKASLAQIDALNPRKVIIVDGCYDPKQPNTSTDGTREIIEAWVASHPQASMISALRFSRLAGLWFLFGVGMRLWNFPLRVALMFYYSRTHIYRINQAATFAHMLRMSRAQQGDWIMHIDADQFYPDDMVKTIIHLTASPDTQAELLTANEQTFFDDFSHYTTEYEKRNYNNMPYRLSKHALIVPTRDVVTEQYPKPVVYGKDTSIKKQHIGNYFHYKFRPFAREREDASYTVGDRKKPTTSTYAQQKFDGTHPDCVRDIVRTKNH